MGRPLSLEVALRSVAMGLPPAVLAAWLLARGRFPGRPLLDGAYDPRTWRLEATRTFDLGVVLLEYAREHDRQP